MSISKLGAATAAGLMGLMALPAQAETSASDAKIALLEAQLKLMERKLDQLTKQTQTNAQVAASANAKATNASAKAASASAKADLKVDVANANAAYPTKAPLLRTAGAYVKMPGNRPTICTDDNQNCVAITSRLHLDVGGYD